MTIKVGLLFSMTGTMAITERGQYEAALLAIKEINKAGGVMGRNLTPVLRDICSSPQIAANEVDSLLQEGVQFFVGLYTSACRKSVLSVLEKQESLLFYPTHYEGGEQHPNVIYCGPSPNQTLLDYIPWVIKNLGKKLYLLGSDYIYPREMNKLIRELVEIHGGKIVKESYLSLGEKNFSQEIKYIQQQKVDVIFSTLVGESAVSLYEEHYHAGLKAPIASTITAEAEIGALPKEYVVGHYSCFPYFSTVNTRENRIFKQKFKEEFNSDIISSAMENAYNSIHLLAKAMKVANSIEVYSVKKHLRGLKLHAPQGEIVVDQYNQHLCLNSRIGKVSTDGLFHIVWESKSFLKPLPFSLNRTFNDANMNFEQSLASNAALIQKLKQNTIFFPHELVFFDAEGTLLDYFGERIKHVLCDYKVDIGTSIWNVNALQNTGMTKAFKKRKISFSIGVEHEHEPFKEMISMGMPIEYKNNFYGVLGCFINGIEGFNSQLIVEELAPLKIIIEQTLEFLDKSKDFTFLYELLTDVSNQLNEALIVKTGKKVLFKNNKADQLVNERNEMMQKIIRESYDHIKYPKREKLSNQTTVSFDLRIVPIHDYRYIYIQKQVDQKNSLKKSQSKPLLFQNIVGKSRRFQEAISQAMVASRNSANVLILGESGTGKEVFARAIHNESVRKNQPFIAINCAAINENLIASELFGYVEGAFTGAKRGGSIGKFEQANGGTLFLDEIGDMPLSLQATLLRVLQEKEIVRVGGNKTIPINVRIIAATNKNLPQEIAYNGSFREDLYYRLNVFTIELISLKQRPEDILDLSNYFLREIAGSNQGMIKSLSEEAMKCLNQYDWPGNIRELRNVIERAYYISDVSSEIHLEHLPRYLYSAASYAGTSRSEVNILHDIKRLNQEKEREHILATLMELNGNITKSSQRLGISRNTLYKKIKEYNLTL